MVKKMSKVQVVASNVKTAFAQAREKFFNAKTCIEDFGNRAKYSRPVHLAPVKIDRSTIIGSAKVTTVYFGGKA